MITEDDLMRFMQENAPARQQPGDITLALVMQPEPTGWGFASASGASGYLETLVAGGVLRKVSMVILDNGKRGNVWRIVEPPSK